LILSEAPSPASATADAPCFDVVEPTLVTEAGHCAALFSGLHGAAPDLAFRLWIDRRAHLAGWHRTRLEPYFSRRWRKPQAWLLYRRLIREGRRVLVPTASYFDLLALDLASRDPIPSGRAFLYFHKLRASESRLRALRRLALRQPEIELFGTSVEIVERLRGAGFARVCQVIPVLAAASAAPPVAEFRHLLSAGAARADKGFAQIVDLVQMLARAGSRLPIVVQASGDHYGRFDEPTRAALERLGNIAYPPLRIVTETLDANQYRALFPGSVCLQPYDPAEYADKMSAVTFDALRAGAPIVTTAGTTMAHIVEQSGAGIVIQTADGPSLLAASAQAIGNFPAFHARSLEAASRFAPQTSWAPLVERLRAALAGASA
jgi:glycosyltransferase involved in cell wall biosynthesis